MEKGWIISGNLLFGWDVIPMNGKHFLRLINIIMITVMIVLSFVTAVAAAKPNHDVERPTVGLALGGGVPRASPISVSSFGWKSIGSLWTISLGQAWVVWLAVVMPWG